MSEYLIQSNTLTEIADSIRSKSSDLGLIKVSHMAESILQIEGFDLSREFVEGTLTNISLSGVSQVGVRAFQQFGSLKEVNFPDVTQIGEGAFYGCTRLSKIDFPQVTEIVDGVFSSCVSLSEVNLPLVKSTGVRSFSDCSLVQLNLPNAVSIGNSSFYSSWNLVSIDLPLVKSIGNSAFSMCSKLVEASLPSAQSLESSSFQYCLCLVSVDSPNVTTIGRGTFSSCSNLVEVNFNLVSSVGNSAFSSCTSLVSMDLPLVSVIENSTFSYCKSLIDVNLPLVTNVYNNAFVGCSSLLEVNFPHVINYSYGTFQNCTNLSIVNFYKPSFVLNNTFRNCSNLTTVIFNGTVLSFYPNSFQNCSNLSTIVIRNSKSVSTLSIGANSFSGTEFFNGKGSFYVPSSIFNDYLSTWTNEVHLSMLKTIEDNMDLLYPDYQDGVQVSINYDLQNADVSNNAVSLDKYDSYTSVISVKEGCKLKYVRVVEGDRDVTSRVYDNGTIFIYMVSGNLKIEVEAVEDPSLIHSWSFAQSLKDFTSNSTSVVTQTSYYYRPGAIGVGSISTRITGVHFTGKANYIDLGAIFSYGRTYEIDVVSFKFGGNRSYNVRFLMFGTSASTSSGVVWRGGTEGVGWSHYSGGWSDQIFEGLEDVNTISGHTIKVKVDSEGYVELFVDGVSHGVSSNQAPSGATNVYLGSSSTSLENGSQLFNCVISGFRVYEIN